jgi:hypothetical protein
MYDHESYSRNFARLLNTALKRGGGDPRAAMTWLNRKYKPLLVLLFSRNKLETIDAYMDVREHITKRIEGEEAGG